MWRRTLAATLLVWFLGTPMQAEELKYGVGSWDSETLGNHRVVVSVENAHPSGTVILTPSAWLS